MQRPLHIHQLQETDLNGPGLFVSDFHAGRSPEADSAAIEFLTMLAENDRMRPDWICFGGDTFDFLVGPNVYAMQRYEELLQAIANLCESDTRILMIEGNHDFHLAFLANQIPNLVVSQRGFRDSKRGITLVHGDVEVAGPLYVGVRALFRSQLTPLTLRLLPQKLTDTGAVTWSTMSHQLRGGEPDDEYLQIVHSAMDAFCHQLSDSQENLLICGHIHLPMECPLDATSSTLYVNGYWPSHQCVVAIHPTENRAQFLQFNGDGLQRWENSGQTVWRPSHQV